MRKRWKTRLRTVLSLALAAMMLASTPCLEIQAAENENFAESEPEVLEAALLDIPVAEDTPSLFTAFADCNINIRCGSDGMYLTFTTCTVGTASVLGVKNIRIQKKEWYGWHTVATSEGLEATDRGSMGCTVLYSNAVKGATYRVLCTHYGNVDKYHEFEADSGEFVFTY